MSSTASSASSLHSFTSRWQQVSAAPASIFAMFDLYTEWGREFYQKPTRDGGRRSTREMEQQRLVMHAFAATIPGHALRFGDVPPGEFCAELLFMIRDWMVAQGLARGEINKRLHRIRRIFKWAAQPPRRWVAATMHEDLKLVGPLKVGRTSARESEPVTSAPEHLVNALQLHLAEQAAIGGSGGRAFELSQMIDLHMHTGMRTSELAEMRRSELHRVDGWIVYQPGEHKTQHHGKLRQIFLGPIAQRLVEDWLRRLDARLLPGMVPRDTLWRWTSGDVYRDQIERAFDALYPPPPELAPRQVLARGRKRVMRCETRAEWRERLGEDRWRELLDWRKQRRFTPGQLRHNFATIMARERGAAGKLAAQKLLGHSTLATTEIYIDPDMADALALLRQVG